MEQTLSLEKKYNEEITTIMNALKQNNNIAESNHGGTHNIKGVVLLSNGSLGTLLDGNYRYYSINRIYVDKNQKPRISTWSVGPTILTSESIDEYGWKEVSPIYNITILKIFYVDGSVVEYAPKDKIISILNDINEDEF